MYKFFILKNKIFKIIYLIYLFQYNIIFMPLITGNKKNQDNFFIPDNI
jgi:hypothetical protein